MRRTLLFFFPLLGGGAARARFVELLGKQRVGDRRIRVRLAGDGGDDKFPHVDPETGNVAGTRHPSLTRRAPPSSGRRASQSSSLAKRAFSFMSFVRSRVGLEPIIAAAYVDAPLDVAVVERTLGAELAKLATEHDALLASTAARAEAREAGRTYREKTPIPFLPICPRSGAPTPSHP